MLYRSTTMETLKKAVRREHFGLNRSIIADNEF
jgi:hypothetical protein